MVRTGQAVWTGSLGAKSGTTGAMRLSDKTLGSLIDLFEERSFAVLFLFLLAPSALPLPTGGLTQVLEAIAMDLGATSKHELQIDPGHAPSVWTGHRFD